MLQERVTAQPVIAAGRFVLRPLRRSDAWLLAMYTGDVRLAEGTRSIPHPLPPGTSEAFIQRALADGRATDVWAMDGSAQDLAEVLGVLSLTRHEDRQSEIAFWVAPGLWNAGFAREAVEAAVAANPHGARTMLAEVFQDSPASARVLTHAGFHYLGDAETHSVARGARVPTWTYVRKMA
jgi:RimJ/RimL family protein N-acetyltransferase